MATSGISKYEELEKKYAAFVGARFGVSTNTGTAALHLALVTLGIGEGDEVIVPDFTMAACGFAVSYTGAEAVFVGCKADGTIDETKIEEKITDRTRAIMPVHIYGRLCNMDAIITLARKHNLFVIEDACEAQGAVYKSRATMTCYSFFKNKIIAAEEGGMITTNHGDYADRARYLKNMAFDKRHTYRHEEIGFNYRMSEAQAKIALRSLKNYEKNAKKRRQIEKWYDEMLPSALKIPLQRDAVWVYDIRHPAYKDVARCVIGARHVFQRLSRQPPWKGWCHDKILYRGNCYLPVHPSMTKKDVKKITKKVCQLRKR